jgi:D-aminoacyl-tRNA deacylase
MRAVVQKVKTASVAVNKQLVGEINNGLLLFAGYEHGDTLDDIAWITQKVTNLRIFNDELQKMNLSLIDTSGDLLLVSQFTLHASTKKGNRPSFTASAKPNEAKVLYQLTIDEIEKTLQKTIQTGVFGAMMDVSLLNDGPVTIILDSKNKE